MKDLRTIMSIEGRVKDNTSTKTKGIQEIREEIKKATGK